MEPIKKLAALIALAVSLISCGGGSSDPAQAPQPGEGFRPVDPPSQGEPSQSDTVEINFGFSRQRSGWVSGFADYPNGEDAGYELVSRFVQLPPPLDGAFGLNLSGNNLSDDLFMFAKRKFSGFEANTQYQLRFEITIASNAPAACVGIGGAPGEGVSIKAGATASEPMVIIDGSGWRRVNIDKGNQKTGGSDALNLGDFANTKACEENNFDYEFKTLKNDVQAFTVITASDGTLWLFFATDSGFEGPTSIYFTSGKLTATKLDR